MPVLAVLEQQRSVVQGERDEALRELLAAALPDAATQPETASAEAPRASADGALAEARELLAAGDSKGYDALQPYPCGEPDYPISPGRIGLRLTDSEHAAIAAWEASRAHWRETRDAWNERREQLLLQASAQRVPTGKATLTDALVRALTRPEQGPKTTVRLMTDPLTGWARTQDDELLPPSVVDGIVRTFPASADQRRLDLRAHDQGRASRLVSPALRRLLGQLDGERCRFPGCRHTRFLNAHHVLYWRHGGVTDLSNLVLLCGKHHRLLHDLGYQLELGADRTLHVTAPDGTVLEPQPMLPAASAEALPPATPTTVENGYAGDRLDLGYAVNVMLAHAA